MFSLDYFKYLIKSNKYLLLLIGFISLLTVVGTREVKVSLYLQFFISLGLCFILPITIFYHVHDKKAVDTYFSIPVSRKKILFTGLLFCFLVAYISLLIPIIADGIRESTLMQMFMLMVVMVLVMITLIVFNTMIYLIANNIVDGVIILAAYTCLPLFAYFVIYNYINAYVAGGIGGFDISFVNYTSILAMAFKLLNGIIEKTQVDFLSIGLLFIILIVSFILLRKEYVERQVERAGTRSDNFFGYPLIINLYVFICLAILATGYNFRNSNIKDFVSENFIFYLLLFAVYVVAHFIYRRKFYLNYKLAIFYLLAIMTTLLFASMFKNSRGFGLADKYILSNKNFYSVSMSNCGTNSDIFELIRKKGDMTDPDYIYVAVQIGDEKHRMSLQDETVQMMEEYRKMAIESFYEPSAEYNYDVSFHVDSKDGNNIDRYYSYFLDERLSVTELTELLKDPLVKVFVYTEQHQYMLEKNGELMEYTN